MSVREKKEKRRQATSEDFKEWHTAECPRLKQEPGEVCDGVSVWWVTSDDRRFKTRTCLEAYEAEQGEGSVL